MTLVLVKVLLTTGCAPPVRQDQEVQSLPDSLPSATFPSVYKVDPYIAAAQRLQAKGRRAAEYQLMNWAEGLAISVKGIPGQAFPPTRSWDQWPPVSKDSPPRKLKIEDEDKIYILCRMLFVARPGSRFDPPFLGVPGFLGEAGQVRSITNGFGSWDYPLWPLCPIEIVDGVPFLITTGYDRQGIIDPDEVKNYVRYCIKNCDWSDIQFIPKSKEQKTAALEKLLASPNFGVKRGPRGRSGDHYVREWLRSEIE